MVVYFNFMATFPVPLLSSLRDILPLSCIDFKQVIGADLWFACVLEVFSLFLKDLKSPVSSLVLVGEKWGKLPLCNGWRWVVKEEKQLLTKTFMGLGQSLFKKVNGQALNDKIFWIFCRSGINVKLGQWDQVAHYSLSSGFEKFSIRFCKMASGKPILDCK